MVKILVFDTETNGLPPQLPGTTWTEREAFDKSLLTEKGLETWDEMKHIWPSIIQLSYILYDTKNPSDAKVFNKYIDIPDNIVISEDSMDVHHITKEKIASVAPENRAKIQDALNEFLGDIKISNVVVGHNVKFDRKMVVAELLRLSTKDNLLQVRDMMNDDKFECTMIETTSICQLQQKIAYKDKITGKDKFFYKIKSPKLSEAYRYFFGYKPAEKALHDALIDVVVCLRVFCKYKYGIDVCGQNSTITSYIMSISPEGYTCKKLESDLDVKEMAGGSKKTTRKLKKHRNPKKHINPKKHRKLKKSYKFTKRRH